MTDDSGKLTEEEKKLIVDWLKSHGQNNIVCPVCGDNNWFIGDHVVQPITLGGGGAAA
jgi:hypothetical protein